MLLEITAIKISWEQTFKISFSQKSFNKKHPHNSVTQLNHTISLFTPIEVPSSVKRTLPFHFTPFHLTSFLSWEAKKSRRLIRVESQSPVEKEKHQTQASYKVMRL